jgi:hypothetical protein
MRSEFRTRGRTSRFNITISRDDAFSTVHKTVCYCLWPISLGVGYAFELNFVFERDRENDTRRKTYGKWETIATVAARGNIMGSVLVDLRAETRWLYRACDERGARTFYPRNTRSDVTRTISLLFDRLTLGRSKERERERDRTKTHKNHKRCSYASVYGTVSARSRQVPVGRKCWYYIRKGRPRV